MAVCGKRLRAILAVGLTGLVLLVTPLLAQKPASNYVENGRKLRAVLLVKDFANRAFSFEDSTTRILSVARFADLLWKEDEIHARQLFTRALELCTPATDATATDRERLARLRREVIAIISTRDVALAKQLTKDNESGSEAGATNLRVANRLLQTEPEAAVNFARRGLDSGV